MLPDKIILSCNEDETYSDFWKPVSWAYKKVFPDVSVHLAFLTNRDQNDPVVEDMREFGEVTLFPILPDVPQAGQAKMIRFILASRMAEKVCYIDDIDLFPLQADFITSKLEKRPTGVLLCVGGEVYGFNGCYPISQMTAEGYIWQKFINPNSLRYEELVRSWKDKAFYDHRENINIWEPDMLNDYYFSDERLLKRLLVENPVPKLELKRGYDDYLESTIDRHTQNKETGEWIFDHQKLKDGKFVNAHCIRPYRINEHQFAPLFAFINRNYGEG